MGDNAEVKLGAEVSNLKAGMNDAASVARDKLSQIGRYLLGVAADGKTSERELSEALTKIKRAFTDTESTVKTATQQSSAHVSAFQKSVVGAAAAMIGAWVGHEMIASIFRIEGEVEKLERVMGVGSEKATNLAIALRLAGSSADTFTSIALHIGRAIKENSAEFERLKITIKDSNGELLPMEQIMKNVYTRMQDFKAGTDQNMLALTAAGLSASQFADVMENLERVQGRANELQKQFGLEIGPAQQAKIKAFKTELEALRIAMVALALNIGNEVMGSLQGLAAWMVGEGPRVITAIVTALKGFASVISLVDFAVSKLAINFGASLDAMQVIAQARNDSIKAIFTTGIGSLPAIWDNAMAKVQAIQRARDDSVLAEQTRTVDALSALWSKAGVTSPAAGGGVKSGPAAFPLKPKKGGAVADDRLAQWKDELVKMQEAQGYFNELSKAQEAQFWQDKLSLVRTNGAADVKLRRDLNRLIFENNKAAAHEQLRDALATWQLQIDAARNDKDAQIANAVARTATMKAIYGEQHAAFKQALDQEIKLREQWEKKEEEIAKIHDAMISARAQHEIEIERLNLGQAVALRQVSADQAFAIEQQLENRIYAVRLKTLQEELARLDNRTKEYATVAAQIEGLEQAHQLKLTEIHNKAELERKQYAIAAAQAVQDNFANLLTDLVSGTKNWRDAFKDAIKSLTGDLNRLASQQIAKQLFGPGTDANSFLSNIFGKIFGTGAAGGKASGEAAASAAVTSAKTSEATATGIVSTALELMTAAANSAAAALAAVGSSGGGGIGSLFGGSGGAGVGSGGSGMFGEGTALAGYALGTPYVPQDSLAIVHKGEAIIPAQYNRPGAHGGAMTNNFSFHLPGPIDTRTQYQIQEATARGVRIASMRHSGTG